MYKPKTYILLFAIFFLSAFSIYKVFKITPKNYLAYEKTLRYTQPSQQERQGVTHRKKVTKSLWMQKKNQLYQYLITSNGSTLHLNQAKSKETKMVEKMNHSTCLLQQKIYFVDEEGKEIDPQKKHQRSYYPMQQICKLEVEKGSYNYFTKKFEGASAMLYLYEIPTHEFHADLDFTKAKKLIEGKCDQINFYFIETVPNLKLFNLVAQIYDE